MKLHSARYEVHIVNLLVDMHYDNENAQDKL